MLTGAKHFAIAALVASLSPLLSQSIPKVDSKTLDGKEVRLPEHATGKPVLLMLGFSHKSENDFKKWNQCFKEPYVSDPRLDYYELVDLQGIPSLIRRMILHGMRHAIQEPERSRFAPFYTQEEEWKKLVSFSDPAVAYIVLADSNGHLLWQTSGPATTAKSDELNAAVTKLGSTRP